MRRGRRFFTATLLFWALMMGLLVRGRLREQARGGGERFLDLISSAPSATNCFGIYRGRRKLGYAEATISADAGAGSVNYRVDLYAKILAPAALSLQGFFVCRDPGGLAEFSFQARSGTGMLLVNGRRHGADYLVTVDAGKGGFPSWSPLAGLLPGGRRTFLVPAGEGSAPGVTLEASGEEVVEIRGVLTAARGYTARGGGGEVRFWINRSGGLIRADLPDGIRIVREPRPLAADI